MVVVLIIEMSQREAVLLPVVLVAVVMAMG
jgi:hypothetical protein